MREILFGRLPPCFKSAHNSLRPILFAQVTIFAKTRKFASVLNYALAQDSCQKRYRVLATGPVPLGTLRHCYWKAPGQPLRYRDFHPRLLRPLGSNGATHWGYAELEVAACRPVFGGRLFDCEVVLGTGKTHQIRLQMACIGSVVFGDSKYKPANGLQHGGPGSKESFNTRLFGEDPSKVGLHAERLTFELPANFEALLGDDEDGEDETGMASTGAAPSSSTSGMKQFSFAAAAPWWESAAGAAEVEVVLEAEAVEEIAREVEAMRKVVVADSEGEWDLDEGKAVVDYDAMGMELDEGLRRFLGLEPRRWVG